jgi:hypothetical protein
MACGTGSADNHYMGCDCHEEKRNTEIANLKEALRVAREGLEKVGNGMTAFPQAIAKETIKQIAAILEGK